MPPSLNPTKEWGVFIFNPYAPTSPFHSPIECGGFIRTHYSCHETIYFHSLIFPFPPYLLYLLSPHALPLFQFLSFLSPCALRYSSPYLLSLILYLISI